jgi:hypothetical protein
MSTGPPTLSAKTKGILKLQTKVSRLMLSLEGGAQIKMMKNIAQIFTEMFKDSLLVNLISELPYPKSFPLVILLVYRTNLVPLEKETATLITIAQARLYVVKETTFPIQILDCMDLANIHMKLEAPPIMIFAMILNSKHLIQSK